MLLFIIFIVFIILILIISFGNVKTVNGGSKNTTIVVDTLNISHALFNKIDIEATIKHVCNMYKGRIMFVVKDRNLDNNDKNPDFLALCKKYKCYIYYTKKYYDVNFKNHAANGRDDFYCLYLANKFDCPILSNDKFRDFREFAKSVEKFQIIEYTPSKSTSNIFNPATCLPYRNRIKKPKLLHTEYMDTRDR
jgi:hypothetical protein